MVIEFPEIFRTNSIRFTISLKNRIIGDLLVNCLDRFRLNIIFDRLYAHIFYAYGKDTNITLFVLGFISYGFIYFNYLTLCAAQNFQLIKKS